MINYISAIGSDRCELQALVNGNHLLKANINTIDELWKLRASPTTKDSIAIGKCLDRTITLESENTGILERYLLEINKEDPNPESLD